MDNIITNNLDDINQTEVQRPMLNSIGLEQFRLNPFRVLRLPVTATSKQSLWQAEKVLALARLNLPPQEPDPLPWLPGNNEMEIRQAVQKMEEPLQRIADQLLWFDFTLDPQSGLLQEGLMQVDKQKLWDYLLMKKPELSLELISSDEIETDTALKIFAHCINKANLCLILALSEFHGIGPKMTDEEIATEVESSISKDSWRRGKDFYFLLNPHELIGCEKNTILRTSIWKVLWTDALNNWYKILTNPHFSTYLKHLLSKLGDEMLDEGAIETISHAVPARLADILVGEIKNTINRGTVELVSDMIDIAASAQFDKRFWNDSFNTLHYFFQLELYEINCLIEDDSAVSKENIWHFFKRVEEVKLKWKGIDPHGALGLLKLVDDSVLMGLEAIALLDYYGDKLKDVENLLKKAVEIAPSNSVQERINSYRSQINQWHQYSTCHFCEKRKSDPEYTIVVKGKKETHREYGFNSTKIYYNIKSVIVLRCENCAHLHRFIKNTSFRFCTFSFFALIISLFGFNRIFNGLEEMKYDFWAGLIGLILIIAPFFLIYWMIMSPITKRIISLLFVPKGQKSLYRTKKAKSCRELLSDGYRIEKIDTSKNALKKQG
jgi:hypothetical protein